MATTLHKLAIINVYAMQNFLIISTLQNYTNFPKKKIPFNQKIYIYRTTSVLTVIVKVILTTFFLPLKLIPHAL